MVDMPSNIVPQAGSPPPVKAGKTAAQVGMPAPMRTMRILLEDNPDIPPSGQFIGINGSSYMLRTGEWFDVPMAVIEVLNNAVTMTAVVDNQKMVTGYREKMRYPYRVAPGQGDFSIPA